MPLEVIKQHFHKRSFLDLEQAGNCKHFWRCQKPVALDLHFCCCYLDRGCDAWNLCYVVTKNFLSNQIFSKYLNFKIFFKRIFNKQRLSQLMLAKTFNTQITQIFTQIKLTKHQHVSPVDWRSWVGNNEKEATENCAKEYSK